MPIYGYICTDCGHEFDRFLPLARYNEPQNCPECSGTARKVLTCVVHGDVPRSEKDRHSNWIETTNVGLTHKNPNHKWGKPITNRTELKKRMKEKGVVHTD